MDRREVFQTQAFERPQHAAPLVFGQPRGGQEALGFDLAAGLVEAVEVLDYRLALNARSARAICLRVCPA